MLPAIPETPRPRPRVCAGLLLAATLLAVLGVLLGGATAPAQAAPAAGPAAPAGTPPPCTTQFGDVPFGSAFYPFVRNLACGAVLSGYADGTFRPGNPITRGQLAKIVANAANVNAAPGAQTFADVPPDNPFYAGIQRLAAQGAISGYTCGGPGEPCDAQNRPYFRPNAGATRGQISKIVATAAGFAEQPTGQTFADVPSTAPFYVWVERLAARGVISGYDCGSPGEPCDAANRPYFRPNAGATRGQVAKIVANTFYPNAYPAQAMIGDALQLGPDRLRHVRCSTAPTRSTATATSRPNTSARAPAARTTACST